VIRLKKLISIAKKLSNIVILIIRNLRLIIKLNLILIIIKLIISRLRLKLI